MTRNVLFCSHFKINSLSTFTKMKILYTCNFFFFTLVIFKALFNYLQSFSFAFEKSDTILITDSLCPIFPSLFGSAYDLFIPGVLNLILKYFGIGFWFNILDFFFSFGLIGLEIMLFLVQRYFLQTS